MHALSLLHTKDFLLSVSEGLEEARGRRKKSRQGKGRKGSERKGEKGQNRRKEGKGSVSEAKGH